jgi:hypothetical protein
MSQLLALAIQGARVPPALLTAEGAALGDSPDRATDAVVAEQVDQLQQRINESPQLRGLAAVIIEIATTGPASRPGGRCDEYDPTTH